MAVKVESCALSILVKYHSLQKKVGIRVSLTTRWCYGLDHWPFECVS